MTDLKKHFTQATEKFQFTVNLGGWRGKKVFEFNPNIEDKRWDPSVHELSILGKGMNVKSITNVGLMLYSFDMLDNKITAKIKFTDVELGNTVDV
jgi:hypothetical protein